LRILDPEVENEAKKLITCEEFKARIFKVNNNTTYLPSLH